MTDKSTILQVIGSLMKKPDYLAMSDKYQLTPEDFENKMSKYIFIAIDTLYTNGASRIQPIDVENYLSTNETASQYFKQNNGIELLQDADALAAEENFPYYYTRLKKFNLLTVLKSKGIDIAEIYIEDGFSEEATKINSQFEDLTIDDIVQFYKSKLLGIESQFVRNDTTETTNAFDGIEEIIENAETLADVGAPLQGDIFNEVCAGARKGIFILRSGSSGVSKTRQAVGDACYLAFPFRYDTIQGQWVQVGSGKKVMFIATEQTKSEIQKMILAYLTGFNETRFRYGGFTEEEQVIIRQALYILETYKDNFMITRMPSPTISLVKNVVRETVLMNDIEYVFYDYIFISPSLLSEFKGFNLRNDEILLMFSTALKDLAVELNVFMMSSTQVNANADNNANIRNESSIAGSRSVINKADIGVIMARPTNEELEFLAKAGELAIRPNIVTDVYKVRSGEWNQVRIWSDVDLGNLRKKDLFVTDARMNVLKIGTECQYQYQWDDEALAHYTQELEEINAIK